MRATPSSPAPAASHLRPCTPAPTPTPSSPAPAHASRPHPGHRTRRVGHSSVSGIVEGGGVGLVRSRRRAPNGITPSRGLHLIVSIQPVRSIRAARDDLTRSVGVDSCRSGVSPHRTQAPSRSWPPVTLPPLPATPFRRLSAPALPAPVQQGPVSDAFPAFIGAPPGSPAPVRERDANEGA